MGIRTGEAQCILHQVHYPTPCGSQKLHGGRYTPLASEKWMGRDGIQFLHPKRRHHLHRTRGAAVRGAHGGLQYVRHGDLLRGQLYG